MEMVDGGRITPSGAKTGHTHPVATPVPAYITYSLAGVVGLASSSLPFVFPQAAVIQGISGAVLTPPAGADLIIDVHLNGTTIFTNQANRPRIVDGTATVSGVEVTTMDVTTVAAGDLLTVNIDQVGSSFAGEGLVVTVRYAA